MHARVTLLLLRRCWNGSVGIAGGSAGVSSQRKPLDARHFRSDFQTTPARLIDSSVSPERIWTGFFEFLSSWFWKLTLL
jgi:hypothetical protein